MHVVLTMRLGPWPQKNIVQTILRMSKTARPALSC